MNITSLIDWLLELTVVGSFSRVGYEVRRRLFGWKPPADRSLSGRTVLITGPTSGLGRATADALAATGARLVLVARDEKKLQRLRAEFTVEYGEDRFPTVVADMSSIASVRAAAEEITRTEPRLDVVIDNAGAMFHERRESPDGIELTLATMVVGPFLLIGALLPMLRRSPDGRVVAVTSGGMYAEPLPLDDLEYRTAPFNGPRAYARAKRAQTVMVREWARRLSAAGSGVAINAMHPGWADTPGLVDMLPGFHRLVGPLLRTPAEGADTVVWLASDPEAGSVTGGLFLDRRPRPFDRIPSTRLSSADRRRLWDLIVRKSGEKDPLL